MRLRAAEKQQIPSLVLVVFVLENTFSFFLLPETCIRTKLPLTGFDTLLKSHFPMAKGNTSSLVFAVKREGFALNCENKGFKSLIRWKPEIQGKISCCFVNN